LTGKLGDGAAALRAHYDATGSTFTEAEKADAARLAETLPGLPRRQHPKVHQADIPDVLPAPDSKAFHAGLSEAVRKRAKGDPLAANIAAVGRAVFYAMITGVRQTLEQLAKRAGCCIETARKCILFLEEQGLFGVLNVLVRKDRDLVRGANLYLAPWAIAIAAPGLRLSRRVAERAAKFIADCSRVMGLAARTFGLNATPERQPGGT
jgi:hypothetical protein